EITVVRPAAVVVDFRMPLMNGLGLLYRLREAEGVQRTPVMVVTGDTSLDGDVRAQLQDLGAVVYFKPITADALLKRFVPCSTSRRRLVSGLFGEPEKEM